MHKALDGHCAHGAHYPAMKTLREWMAEKGETDDTLAGKLVTDRTTISRLRRGKQRPSWALARKLADLTKGEVTADSFMVLDDGADDDETAPDPADAKSHPESGTRSAALRHNQSVIRSGPR